MGLSEKESSSDTQSEAVVVSEVYIDKYQHPLMPSVMYFMRGGWGRIPRSRKLIGILPKPPLMRYSGINVVGICVYLFF